MSLQTDTDTFIVGMTYCKPIVTESMQDSEDLKENDASFEPKAVSVSKIHQKHDQKEEESSDADNRLKEVTEEMQNLRETLRIMIERNSESERRHAEEKEESERRRLEENKRRDEEMKKMLEVIFLSNAQKDVHRGELYRSERCTQRQLYRTERGTQKQLYRPGIGDSSTRLSLSSDSWTQGKELY